MGKQPSRVSPSQLTLTAPPELLTQCQGQGVSLKVIVAALFCPEATFFFFPFFLCVFSVLSHSFPEEVAGPCLLFCVAVCVCLTALARGICIEINICFQCEIYRKGLREEGG